MSKPYFKLLTGRIERATKDAAAFDLFYVGETILIGDKPVLLPTGVSSEFTPGYVAIMKERSGLGLKGVELKAGVIDADYRGMWGVVARYPVRFNFNRSPLDKNCFEYDPTWKPFEVKNGDKIAQFLLIETANAKLDFMANGGATITMADLIRGEKGFGSTG